jgi:hypothetical protein
VGGVGCIAPPGMPHTQPGGTQPFQGTAPLQQQSVLGHTVASGHAFTASQGHTKQGQGPWSASISRYKRVRRACEKAHAGFSQSQPQGLLSGTQPLDVAGLPTQPPAAHADGTGGVVAGQAGRQGQGVHQTPGVSSQPHAAPMHMELDLDMEVQDMDLDEDRGDVLPASLYCLPPRPRSQARDFLCSGGEGVRAGSEGGGPQGGAGTHEGQQQQAHLGSTPDAAVQHGSGGPLKLLQCSVPHQSVTAFVWSAVRHVVPPQLLGDKHNRR